MIKFKNCQITPKDVNILNSAVHEALKDAHTNVELNYISWNIQIITLEDNNTKIPVIVGQGSETENSPADYTITVKASCINDDIQLESIVIDNPIKLNNPINYQLSPIHELYIMETAEANQPKQETKRETHNQISACSRLIQEIYSDNPDYDSNMPVPKVFFSKLDFDTYMSNLSVTLEESILLWMESTGQLSVNMDDENISVPTILKNNIKRVYMHGAARNHIKVELANNTVHDFHNMSASVQTEICNEILSILPVI
jgi:hypothetical protein